MYVPSVLYLPACPLVPCSEPRPPGGGTPSKAFILLLSWFIQPHPYTLE